MDRNALLMILVFFFVVDFDKSNALYFRKLIATTAPNYSSDATKDSPLPSPLLDEEKPDLSPVEVTKPEDTLLSNSSNMASKGLNDTNNKTNSEESSDKQLDNVKSQDVEENVKNTTQSMITTSESCKGIPSCRDQDKTMIACIQNFENGSNELILLVQNEGDITLKVNLSVATPMNNSLPSFEIPSRRTEKINVPFSEEKSANIVLNAGKGDCELQVDALNSKGVDNPPMSKDIDNPPESKGFVDPPKPNAIDDLPEPTGGDNLPEPTNVDTSISQNNLLKQFSFYSKQVTPLYGACVAFVVALVLGGAWAWCSFTKKRTDGGIPYQELEMGMPESSNALNVETAESWDQDWDDDDDWEENKTIRSPGGGHPVSSNGLTSRPPKTDGWDDDWDD